MIYLIDMYYQRNIDREGYYVFYQLWLFYGYFSLLFLIIGKFLKILVSGFYFILFEWEFLGWGFGYYNIF